MSEDLALDFGTARTRVATAKGVLIFDEPTIAAVDEDTRRLLAFGDEAEHLGATAAGRVKVLRPVRNGQLVDLDLAEMALAYVLSKATPSRLSRPRVLVGLHTNETNVQRRALERALKKAGARDVQFVEQPLACAIAAGMTIAEPEGVMAIDVGAGTTDMAVIALGGVVTSASLLTGGDAFDEAIRNFVARHHGVVLSWQTAEELKRSIGSVAIDPPAHTVEVDGREIATGAVAHVRISSADLAVLLDEAVRPILDAAVQCIVHAPPDLANDLLTTGLVLAGSGGLLHGFDQRLASATGVAVHVADEGNTLAVRGAAACLQRLDVTSVVSSSR